MEECAFIYILLVKIFHEKPLLSSATVATLCTCFKLLGFFVINIFGIPRGNLYLDHNTATHSNHLSKRLTLLIDGLF